MSLDFIAGVERRLLGTLLNHPKQVPGVSRKLREDSFADMRHQVIWDHLIALTQSGRSDLDVADLIEDLDRGGVLGDAGGREYVLELTAEPGTLQYKGLEALAAKVEETAVRRRAAAVLRDGVSRLGDSGIKHDEAMADLQTQLREILADANREELPPIGFTADELLSQLETGIDPGTPTGLARLDDYILGGIKPTQLVVLAGNTGSGKTSLAIQIALRGAEWAQEDASKRGPVLIFSYEMAGTELLQRMIAQSAVLQDGFRPPEGFSRRDRPKVRETLERFRTLPMHIEDSADRTVETVRAAVERFIYANGQIPSLVVVDHIGLMSAPSRKNSSRREEVDHITGNLKAMAMQLRVPVLAMAQLSRQSNQREDHRPKLSDLRESGSIEQDANIVLLIYRESYFGDLAEREKLDREGAPSKLMVAKNRAGSVGEVDLLWYGPRTLFVEPTIEAEDGMARPSLDPAASSSAVVVAGTPLPGTIDALADMFVNPDDDEDLVGNEGQAPF